MDLFKIIAWTQNALVFFTIILALVVFVGLVIFVNVYDVNPFHIM